MSVIHQREVGFDTGSFASALRRVLRQDPDVILIGEMRDEETVRTALSAAETGHLVLSTLHTIDAVETVNRIVDFFPPHQHQQVRAMLAGTLKGVISQRLVPTIDHSGRVAACEVLTMTGRVRDMIMDPNETGKLGEVIGEGGYYGMTTFDQSLFNLYTEGSISLEQALEASTHPHDFKLLVASEGQRSTSVSHLYGDDKEESATEEPQPAQQQAPQRPAQQQPSPRSRPAAVTAPAAPARAIAEPRITGTGPSSTSGAAAEGAQAGPEAPAGAPSRASAGGGTAAFGTGPRVPAAGQRRRSAHVGVPAGQRRARSLRPAAGLPARRRSPNFTL